MRRVFLLVTLAATTSAADEAFVFTIMDVFAISGGEAATVITGKVESGTVSVGDTVCLRSKQSGNIELIVTGIEFFRKTTTTAQAGDMVGIGVNGVGKDSVSRGDTLSASCDK